MKVETGGDGGRKAFVHGISSPAGEGEGYFLKSTRKRRTPAHEHYIYAKDRLLPPRISLSQSRDSCSQRRVSCIRTKFSREFSHISYSRQKVVPLFRKSYHFFPISAVPVAVSAVPIARNAHPAHANRFLLQSEGPLIVLTLFISLTLVRAWLEL